MTSTRTLAERALEQGEGILRLAPAWVPRDWLVPGNRIKLHPDDRFTYGGDRGGISERWMSSTTQVDNGPSTSPNEGRGYVVFQDGKTTEQFLLRDAIDELKGGLIGDRIWEENGCWPVYSKFFDFQCPLPIHIHHREEHSSLVGEMAKAEAYYFPAQLNNHLGDFPCAFFGLKPGTTKEQVRECLLNFEKGDNRITELSVGYTMELGTGWDTPPGILHAPGSLCTYDPQRATGSQWRTRRGRGPQRPHLIGHTNLARGLRPVRRAVGYSSAWNALEDRLARPSRVLHCECDAELPEHLLTDRLRHDRVHAQDHHGKAVARFTCTRALQSHRIDRNHREHVGWIFDQ